MTYDADLENLEQKLKMLKVELTGHPHNEKPDFLLCHMMTEDMKADIEKLSDKIFKDE